MMTDTIEMIIDATETTIGETEMVIKDEVKTEAEIEIETKKIEVEYRGDREAEGTEDRKREARLTKR